MFWRFRPSKYKNSSISLRLLCRIHFRPFVGAFAGSSRSNSKSPLKRAPSVLVKVIEIKSSHQVEAQSRVFAKLSDGHCRMVQTIRLALLTFHLPSDGG
jgi:hypothetical protein